MKVGAPWPQQLTADELAALDPGVPDRPERRPDVLVVGGGVVGVATAAACRNLGLGSVVLIERGQLGAGATGGAGGLLIPEARRGLDPPALIDLARASLADWRELEGSVPGGVGLVDLDWLALEPLQADFSDGLPPGAERLDADQVGRVAPDLARPVAGVLVRHQARVNPLRSVARLDPRIGAAWTGVEALGVSVQGDRVVAVATSAGELTPGAVVFATGGPPTIAGLELDVPAGQLKGHLVTTEAASIRLPGTVSGVATPLEGGQLLAGGTLDVGDDAPVVRPEVIASIQAELRAAVPALRGVAISNQWCCFRPTHPDGLPVIDRVPGLANAWVTTGHFRNGILMAPATGRALAAWIADGQQPAEVRGFEISRFAAG